MSVVPSLAESRLAMSHQHQPIRRKVLTEQGLGRNNNKELLLTTRNGRIKANHVPPTLANQAKGVNGAGTGPQQQQRTPANNTNFFIEVLQSMQHSQQQLMEEIRQMKTDKMKEKEASMTQCMRQTREKPCRGWPTERRTTFHYHGRSCNGFRVGKD